MEKSSFIPEKADSQEASSCLTQWKAKTVQLGFQSD